MNGFETQIKRQSLSDWIKQDPTICCLQKPFIFKNTNYLRIKGWKLCMYHANNNHKKAGVAIVILDSIDFKTKKNVTRNKEGYFILIKG